MTVAESPILSAPEHPRDPSPRPASDRRARAEWLLAQLSEPHPDEQFGLERGAAQARSNAEDPWDDALATLLMDSFRRTGSERTFEGLVELVSPMLLRRARTRVRYADRYLDAHEVVQDTLVNIYRYPERFDASKPSAFRYWASMILDNAARRQLRRSRSGIEVQTRPNEALMATPDAVGRQPVVRAQDKEDCRGVAHAFTLLLGCYLDAYAGLSARERFVLQMVEVHGMKYADLARQLPIRPEALKMVVFRARRRILERIGQRLSGGTDLAAA